MQGIGFWASRGEYLLYNKTQTFQRNNCPSGQEGSYVSFSRQYVGINEQQLQELIAEDAANFNATGQAQANATGSCSVIPPPYQTKANSRPRRIVGFDDNYVYGSPHDNTRGLYRYSKAAVIAGQLSTATLLHNSLSEEISWDFKVAGITYRANSIGFVDGQYRIKVEYFGTNDPNSPPLTIGVDRSQLPLTNTQTMFGGRYINIRQGPGGARNGFGYTAATGVSGLFRFSSDFSGDINLGTIPGPDSSNAISWIDRPPCMAYNGSNIYLGFMIYPFSSLPFPTPTTVWDYSRGRLIVVRVNNNIVTQEPESMEVIYDSSSTADPILDSMCNMGSDILCFVRESTTRRIIRIGTGTYADPPNIGVFGIDWSVGDNVEIFATSGFMATGINPPPTRIFRYVKSSNSWSLLFQ